MPLHADDRTAPTLRSSGSGDAVPLLLPALCPSIFDTFVAAIERGAPPAVTAADDRAVVALVTAAHRSAASGRVEEVEQIDDAGRGRAP